MVPIDPGEIGDGSDEDSTCRQTRTRDRGSRTEGALVGRGLRPPSAFAGSPIQPGVDRRRGSATDCRARPQVDMDRRGAVGQGHHLCARSRPRAEPARHRFTAGPFCRRYCADPWLCVGRGGSRSRGVGGRSLLVRARIHRSGCRSAQGARIPDPPELRVRTQCGVCQTLCAGRLREVVRGHHD